MIYLTIFGYLLHFLDIFSGILLDSVCTYISAWQCIHLLCCQQDILYWAGAKTRSCKFNVQTQMLDNSSKPENDCINLYIYFSDAQWHTGPAVDFHIAATVALS